MNEIFSGVGYNVSCVLDSARDCPMPINKEATVESQFWILFEQIQKELEKKNKNPDILFCDRSVIDAQVYTEATVGSFDIVDDVVEDWIDSYDLIIKLNRNKEYLTKLKEMDKYISNKLNDLKGKTVLIYHPVLGYFTDEYELKLKAIEKNGKEATPKRLQELIDFAKKENLKTIFHQSTIDSKQTEVIASEINGKTVEINPLAENYIENMKKIANLIANSYQ